MTEATLNRRAAKPQESVEETVSQRMEVEKLHQAIVPKPPKYKKKNGAGWYDQGTGKQCLGIYRGSLVGG